MPTDDPAEGARLGVCTANVDRAGEGGVLPWTTALREAVRAAALRRSLIAAGIVGTTLAIANFGSDLSDGAFSTALGVRLALTYLVPWANATVGIAIGIRDRLEIGPVGQR